MILFLIAFSRITIGLVFLVSAISKITNFTAFEKSVRNFSILPPRSTRIASIIFTFGEAIVVVLMIIGNGTLIYGFSLAGLLLIIFSLALISVLIRGITTNCNCFGSSEKSISQLDIWRNIGFILCVCTGLIGISLQDTTRETFTVIEWGVTTVIGIAFVIISLNIREVYELLR